MPENLLDNLKVTVEKLNWTGGSEIEFIETVDGTRYLIDWNPRFPAWIHGSTVAVGVNLPLTLIGAAALKSFGINIFNADIAERLNSGRIVSPSSTGTFSRTVVEQLTSGVQPLVLAGPEDSSVLHASCTVASKGSGANRPHPSRNTSAAKQLKPPKSLRATTTAETTAVRASSMELPSPDQLQQILSENGRQTPFILFNHQRMRSTVDTMRRTISLAVENVPPLRSKPCRVDLALSIKTNPSIDVLKTGLNNGLLGEAISLPEVRAALTAGFASENIILNGPGKWYDRPQKNQSSTPIKLLAVIADSAEELEELTHNAAAGRPLSPVVDGKLQINGATYIGVRLAAPGTGSRFGVDIGNPKLLQRVAIALQRLPAEQKTVFHFHYASSTLGLPAWTGAVKAVLLAAATIDQLAGRTCSMLDFGGGWATDTFTETVAVNPLTEIFADAVDQFPALERIVFEPGKSLVQTEGVLITRILSIREPSAQLRESQKDDDREDESRIVILDTSIAELPDLNSHNHPFAYLSQNDLNTSNWQNLSTSNGSDAIYGRICMEHDILARSVQLPDDLKMGDFIAIGAVGAYDTSMAYNFGAASQPFLPISHLSF